ncbi:helix-turn-helix domain-containing protein [Lacticaseibacillus absianus]|uniref:helix-turn-helix domain-containing protein n=1 Tax=Lacticaseibacillus absianus TaxID=2729623 RepID=UPI0015CD92ED|nr:Rgg/GadR/MutR family transcriptional regulator [Lacticaseibacillus absianus]
MDDGTLFRELRRNRHLTLQQVADATNSVAAISKFERGLLAIGFARFEHLLGRIEVSLEEFVFLRAQRTVQLPAPDEANRYREGAFNSQDDPVFEALIQRMGALTSTGVDDPAMIADFDTDVARYLQPADGHVPTRRERFSALMIQVMQAVLRGNELGRRADQHPRIGVLMAKLNEMVRPLVSYLYSVETWGYFELYWFSVFHIFIANDTSHQLLRVALTRSEQYALFPSVQHMRVDLLFGVFTDFINARQLQWAQAALAEADRQIQRTGDLGHANNLLFCRGWFQIIAGDVAGGTQTCQQAISIERILGVRSDHGYADVLRIILRNQEDGSSAAFYM